jgi:2-oxoisovalerate dehydrogenase E1 component subunit alpha
MFDHVYPNGSPLLDEQRAEFSRYSESFAGEAH